MVTITEENIIYSSPRNFKKNKWKILNLQTNKKFKKII